MNRRHFFAALTAPLVARFTPKELPGNETLRPGDVITMDDVVYLRNPMPIKVYAQFGVDFEFSTADACLNLDELRQRYT